MRGWKLDVTQVAGLLQLATGLGEVRLRTVAHGLRGVRLVDLLNGIALRSRIRNSWREKGNAWVGEALPGYATTAKLQAAVRVPALRLHRMARGSRT